MRSSFPQILGSRIKEAREQAGFTQEQFAPVIGVTVATVSRDETGKTKQVSFDRLAAISDATGKPMAWFLKGLA